MNPELREKVVTLILTKGHQSRPDGFRLASGELSNDYIDGKQAIAHGTDLRLVTETILDHCHANGIEFDAVGGLTLGADPLAHAIALIGDKEWFSVRKEIKDHGKQKLLEGAKLGPGYRVLLVDDVVTTGGSIVQALDPIESSGAKVVLAVAMVDRGKSASDRLEERGVKFVPICTYEDLGIDPVGSS